MTERGEYRCIVKDAENGQPWIVFEPYKGGEISQLKRRVLGMYLKPGTSLLEAQKLALHLSQHMVGLSLTDHLRPVE